MVYSPLNYLLDEITNREIPQADTILDLLHPNKDRARSIFISQLNIALKEYCKHYPLTLSKEIYRTPYVFIDNFEGYRLGNITRENLELIPQSIANVQATILSKAITRNNYIYDIETHTLHNATGLVTYFTNYPIYSKYDENNMFTEDSGVYLLDPNSSEGEMFIDQLSYNLLFSIHNSRRTVSPQFGVQFFDFSDRLNELTGILSLNNTYSSTIYNIWAKTGI